MKIDTIFRNNRAWAKQKTKANPSYFSDLSKGQKPEVLYIGCSDSRVTAEELMGMAPGEVFIHRNIANMVSNLDLSAMSVINYSVEHLEVQHIVICGHYNCGGIKAAMQSEDLGILNPWLRSIRDVYRLRKKELDRFLDDEKRYRRFVELNVEEQCINVIKTPEVQRAIRNRGLSVHGWVFDMGSGRLIDLRIEWEEVLTDIMEIYRLDCSLGSRASDDKAAISPAVDTPNQRMVDGVDEIVDGLRAGGSRRR